MALKHCKPCKPCTRPCLFVFSNELYGSSGHNSNVKDVNEMDGLVHGSKEISQQGRETGKSGYTSKHQKDGVKPLTVEFVSTLNRSSKRPQALSICCCFT